MKKIALLTSFILLGLALAGQSRWAFGLELTGGYGGRANLKEQTYPDPQFGDFYTKSQLKCLPGGSAGIWTEFLLSHRVGLRLGVNYGRWSLLSELENISYNTEDVMVSYALDRYQQQQSQLNIPLEGKLYFGPADRPTRFFVKTGMQAGYLLAELGTTDRYFGALGQNEALEEFYASKVDLKATWPGESRWDVSIIGGLGMMTDRITLSVQRNWSLKKEEIYNLGCCGFGFCDCFTVFPSTNRLANLIEQTSLRFSYRLF